MLINATQNEEVRIALVDDSELLDLDIEQRKNDNKKSNIYNGVISRIEPSLEACFVNYGEPRDGFLPFKDIHPDYVDGVSTSEIKDKLKIGQKVIVQVAREERGNKGAALTTYIALASTFLVLMPNSPDVEGISRRLSSDDRDNLRRKLEEIGADVNEGLIVRTAGVGCSAEELKYDLDILHFIWNSIQQYAKENPEVGLLHHESETIIRVIRDYLTKDVEEIVTDTQDAYDKAAHYLKLVRPKSPVKLTLYDGNDGLFSAYQIEDQINTAFQRTVQLKSGGAIVIDTTEALTAIDVNSSRYTSGTDIETTALNTNLEAADEIARQLKIRDLGGLIVVDFIDMSSSANQKKVEERMRKATADDRARLQAAKISKFGLMEISRQRIRGSIAESNNHICPRCSGTGFIRDNESLALHILRKANEEASRAGRITKLHIVVPNEIASYLTNEKREDILRLEKQHNIDLVVVPQANMQTPHFNIYRVRKGDALKEQLSFKLAEHYAEVERTNAARKSRGQERADEKSAHTQSSVPDEHAGKTFEARLDKAISERPDLFKSIQVEEPQETTFLAKLGAWFKGLFASKPQPVIEEPKLDSIVSKRKSKRQRNREKKVEAESLQSAVEKEEVPSKPTRKQREKERREENLIADVKPDFATALAKQGQADNDKKGEKTDLSKTNLEVKAELKPEEIARKTLNTGDVVEDVFSSKAERKRNKKAKNVEETIFTEADVLVTDDSKANKLSRRERARQRKLAQSQGKELLLAPEYDYIFDDDTNDTLAITKAARRERVRTEKVRDSEAEYANRVERIERNEREADRAEIVRECNELNPESRGEVAHDSSKEEVVQLTSTTQEAHTDKLRNDKPCVKTSTEQPISEPVTQVRERAKVQERTSTPSPITPVAVPVVPVASVSASEIRVERVERESKSPVGQPRYITPPTLGLIPRDRALNLRQATAKGEQETITRGQEQEVNRLDVPHLNSYYQSIAENNSHDSVKKYNAELVRKLVTISAYSCNNPMVVTEYLTEGNDSAISSRCATHSGSNPQVSLDLVDLPKYVYKLDNTDLYILRVIHLFYGLMYLHDFFMIHVCQEHNTIPQCLRVRRTLRRELWFGLIKTYKANQSYNTRYCTSISLEFNSNISRMWYYLQSNVGLLGLALPLTTNVVRAVSNSSLGMVLNYGVLRTVGFDNWQRYSVIANLTYAFGIYVSNQILKKQHKSLNKCFDEFTRFVRPVIQDQDLSYGYQVWMGLTGKRLLKNLLQQISNDYLGTLAYRMQLRTDENNPIDFDGKILQERGWYTSYIVYKPVNIKVLDEYQISQTAWLFIQRNYGLIPQWLASETPVQISFAYPTFAEYVRSLGHESDFLNVYSNELEQATQRYENGLIELENLAQENDYEVNWSDKNLLEEVITKKPTRSRKRKAERESFYYIVTRVDSTLAKDFSTWYPRGAYMKLSAPELLLDLSCPEAKPTVVDKLLIDRKPVSIQSEATHIVNDPHFIRRPLFVCRGQYKHE